VSGRPLLEMFAEEGGSAWHGILPFNSREQLRSLDGNAGRAAPGSTSSDTNPGLDGDNGDGEAPRPATQAA